MDPEGDRVERPAIVGVTDNVIHLRPRTENMQRLSRRRLAVLADEAPPVEGVRPKTRGDCGDERPCPWVGCRHNLFLEVNEGNGSIKYRHPGVEPDAMDPRASCVLDVADRGGVGASEVGRLLNVSRERARQIERDGCAKLRAEGSLSLPEGLGRMPAQSLPERRGDPVAIAIEVDEPIPAADRLAHDFRAQVFFGEKAPFEAVAGDLADIARSESVGTPPLGLRPLFATPPERRALVADGQDKSRARSLVHNDDEDEGTTMSESDDLGARILENLRARGVLSMRDIVRATEARPKPVRTALAEAQGLGGGGARPVLRRRGRPPGRASGQRAVMASIRVDA